MKKIIIIPFVLLFFCQKIANAQYESIFGQNTTQFNVFHVQLAGACYSEPIILIDGIDTNGLHYKRFYNEVYIREDTILGKVYVRIFNYNPPFDPSRDVLIMDLNLQVGDTFNLHSDYYPICQSISTSCPYIIIDSVFYENGRKVVRTNCNVGHCSFSLYDKIPLSFIEGVGPNRGPLYWWPLMSFHPFLLCTYKDDTLSYMNPLYNSCDTFVVGIYDRCFNDIGIYPNPLTHQSLVSLPAYIFPQKTSLEIYDMHGRLIKRLAVPNTRQIGLKREDFGASGVYVLRVSSGGYVETLKLLVQ